MDFWTVTLISLIAGLILVIGGALVIYMGSLVKSAYELKVEIQSDVDEGLRRVEEETDKKSRWIKRDLVEEIEKIKTNLTTDNTRRFNELMEGANARMSQLEETIKRERETSARVIEGLRHDVMVLDQRLRAMKRGQKAEDEAQATAEDGASAPQADPAPALPAPSQPPFVVPKMAVPPTLKEV